MFNDIKGHYPTPDWLARKMLEGINFNTIKTVLEPSAGQGHIVEVVSERHKSILGYYNRDKKLDIDCIEINESLQHVLKGKGYRVVYNDFLSYNTYKKYNLIVMNPDFAEGDKHLLKAIEMQEQGGKIRCLLNAETLRNPYSNTRKDLLRKLDQYNAEVEYIENAFVDAERKTGVEIALIKIDIEKPSYNSTILTTLKQEEQFREEKSYNSNQIIAGDYLQGMVDQYNFEIKAGLKLIAEYQALQPLMLNSLKKDDSYNKPILELGLYYKDDTDTLENGYIRQTRAKYWEVLFTSKQFMGLFTSNLKQEYMEKINELKDYDFSLYNIYSIRADLSKQMLRGVEDTILALFEEFSHKHYYHETSNNIHMYNGWKTNSAYKINSKKVIIPLNGFDRWGEGRIDYSWTVKEKLSDIEKVFNYLNNDNTIEHIDLNEALQMAQHYGETKKIELKYFYVTFYKKGTCHIEWKYPQLVHKFNVYGSQSKGWLPPSYANKSYKNMTAEEKSVIDNFEGEKSYNEVMQNKNYYITETSQLLRLTHSA